MARASNNSDNIQQRKGDHIRLSLDPRSQAYTNPFDAYSLPYSALPELSLEDVDTTYTFCGKPLQSPLIIASMTGGSEHGRSINTNLAIAAETCGVAMGVGSQRVGLEKADALETFRLVRTHAPTACIIANMGAVQLNYGHTIDSYRRIVDMVQADALYLHLNPLQEALQPGGDTDFGNLAAKITKLVQNVSVPVCVKEVGHGISGTVAKRLFECGIHGIDVAGVGGTSYAWIEAERSQNTDFAAWFKHVGVPTDTAIQQVHAVRPDPARVVIASGGIRSPIDGLKAHAMGADMFSAATPFLAPALQSPQATITTLKTWQEGLRIALFATGSKNWATASTISLQPGEKES